MNRRPGKSYILPVGLFLVSLLVLTACGEDDFTEPEVRAVQEILLSPDSLALVPDEVGAVEATVLDDDGAQIDTATVSWSSSNAAVATVSSAGEVTGIAAGTVQITASSGGVSNSMDVTVAVSRLAESTVVVDTTAVTLVSDSAERAQGTFRFTVTGTTPDWETGDIIAGGDDGGYLRRVTSINTSASEVVVETEAASLAEAVDAGEFSTTVPLTLSSTGALQPRTLGDVVWSEPRVVYSAPGVSLQDEGSVSLLEVAFGAGGEVCTDGDPPVCAVVETGVSKGTITFTPDFDLYAKLGFLGLKEFRAIATGPLDFEAEVFATAALATEGGAPFEKEWKKELLVVEHRFYIPPNLMPLGVWGEVTVTFVAGTGLRAGTSIDVRPGLVSTASMSMGARYEDDEWTPVFDRSADATGYIDVAGGLDGELRFWVRPEIQLELYNAVGPFIGVDSYLAGRASVPNLNEWEVQAVMGLAGDLGFVVEILDFEVASYDWTFAEWEHELWSASGTRAAYVEVDPPTLEMSPGEQAELTATAYDQNDTPLSGTNFLWNSRDTTVATVDSAGMVTAVEPGNTYIVAGFDEASDSSSVTVTDGPAPSDSLGIGFGNDQFVLVESGTFQMGDITGNGYSNELPVHTVNITQDFYLQKTEVTQAQWQAVMGSNPSYFSACGETCPVEQVSWNDIQVFIDSLNVLYPDANYRLPTEAEWEYAARAGTTGDYGGTGVLDEMGWYSGNSGSTMHPVAQKLANDWGLYDMHGNVLEWVQDWYASDYYSVSPTDDPQGPSSGSYRVLRGGSWGNNASGARSAYRIFDSPSTRNVYFGFRLARTP